MSERDPTDWVGIVTGTGIMAVVAVVFYYAVSLFSG